MEKVSNLNQEVKARTFGYISGALGLVAGLAWNDAIATAVDAMFPLSKDTVGVKFLYAAIVTVAIVIVVGYLEKMINKPTNPK